MRIPPAYLQRHKFNWSYCEADMAQEAGGNTEIPHHWIQEFKAKVAADPTARRAWQKLQTAGLEEGALFLLWGLAGGANPDIAAMHRNSGVMTFIINQDGVLLQKAWGRPRRKWPLQ